MVLWYNAIIAFHATEGLCERTEHLDIFLFFFHPSLNGVLFLMFCLLVEGKCQNLVVYNIINEISTIRLI